MLYPQHDRVSQDYPDLPAKEILAGSVSVARVRPRTSKGITACFAEPTEGSSSERQALERLQDPLRTLPDGAYYGGSFSRGIARTLSRDLGRDPPLCARCDGQTLLWLATGSANLPTQ